MGNWVVVLGPNNWEIKNSGFWIFNILDTHQGVIGYKGVSFGRFQIGLTQERERDKGR